MLTLDQVIALAPDAASVKASRPLSNPRKWNSWASNGDVLWGLAQGSGKKPYQTQIVLTEPAFKCSCPSRKFPCKHALALMFLAASSPDDIPAEEPPDWVQEWLTSREERATKKKATAKAPTDTKAAAKRKDKKLNRIDEGVAILEQFISDLARQGIGDPSVKDPATWENLVRRMVDSQAPGLASLVRHLGSLSLKSHQWETPFIHALGSLHLLLHSWKNRANLEAGLCAEVEQLVGLPVSKEEVLATKPINDHWLVASRTLYEQDRLTTSVTWLYGIKTKRWAKTVLFGPLGQNPHEPWPLGQTVYTDLHFYPGLTQPRALPANEGVGATAVPLPIIEETFTSFLKNYAALRARNPWHRQQPFLGQLRPGHNHDALIDLEGNALPWSPGSQHLRLFHAISGGHPVLTCVEWDGQQLTLRSATSHDQLLNLS